MVTVNDVLTDAAPPGLDESTNKVCYRALHYYCHEEGEEQQQEQTQPSDDDGVTRDNGTGAVVVAKDSTYYHGRQLLKLRSNPFGQVNLVFPIEDYDRLVKETSLADVPTSSAF